MKKINIILLGLLILIAVSCKKTPAPEKPDVGHDYYPTTLGKFVIYDIDSTVYDEFNFSPTYYKYRIKEKLQETFTDNEGRTAYKIYRYIKKYDSTKTYDLIPWTIKDVWMANVTTSNVEVVEENVRFTKLIFPVKDKQTWNGNAKNNLAVTDYTYSYSGQSETINGIYLDQTLLVKQKDFRPLIFYEYTVEKYSKSIGLVYREIIDVKFAAVTQTNVPIDNVQKSGTVYKQKIVDYGYE